jgi:TRAP-type C4-dicarboxylate transport system permease small subunit
MALLAWRLSAGTLAMREAGETTTILGWPLWIAYAAMVPGIALTALAALSNALDHVRKALR